MRKQKLFIIPCIYYLSYDGVEGGALVIHCRWGYRGDYLVLDCHHHIQNHHLNTREHKSTFKMLAYDIMCVPPHEGEGCTLSPETSPWKEPPPD